MLGDSRGIDQLVLLVLERVRSRFNWWDESRFDSLDSLDTVCCVGVQRWLESP
jgi:hypothetical protein